MYRTPSNSEAAAARPLWTAGAGGYDCYRLPNLLEARQASNRAHRTMAPNCIPRLSHHRPPALPSSAQAGPPGTPRLLAVAQGKKGAHCPDSGWMDILVRRSHDGGRTWTAPELVHPNPESTCESRHYLNCTCV